MPNKKTVIGLLLCIGDDLFGGHDGLRVVFTWMERWFVMNVRWHILEKCTQFVSKMLQFLLCLYNSENFTEFFQSMPLLFQVETLDYVPSLPNVVIAD